MTDCCAPGLPWPTLTNGSTLGKTWLVSLVAICRPHEHALRRGRDQVRRTERPVLAFLGRLSSRFHSEPLEVGGRHPCRCPSADVAPRSGRIHWAHVRSDCVRAASNVRHCVARSRAPSRAWRVKVSRQTRTDRREDRRERAPPRTSAPPSGTPSPARRKGPSRCAHGSARCADEPPFLKGRKPWTRRPLR